MHKLNGLCFCSLNCLGALLFPALLPAVFFFTKPFSLAHFLFLFITSLFQLYSHIYLLVPCPARLGDGEPLWMELPPFLAPAGGAGCRAWEAASDFMCPVLGQWQWLSPKVGPWEPLGVLPPEEEGISQPRLHTDWGDVSDSCQNKGSIHFIYSTVYLLMPHS